MRTMFGRQFVMTACLILVCILLLGISFRVFIQGYIAGQQQEALYNNAQAVASLAAAYEGAGDLESNWDFRINLTFAAAAAQTDTLICAPDGRVLLCSCGQLSCDHLGMRLPMEYVEQVVREGKLTASGVLQGLYSVALPVAFVCALWVFLRRGLALRRTGGALLWWLQLGLLGMALLRAAMISFMEVVSFNIGTYVMYLATVHPLLLLFTLAVLLAKNETGENAEWDI